MTLIKDLIDIPDRVYKDEYVLKLSEGVNHPEETLRDYVLTPELKTCFDAALSIIRGAVQSRTSKAAFLHGSFGSGKSHFMAILHLILQGNPAARGIVELAPIIQKHNDWLAGKKFLLVPYHMIGAHDMESGVLGHYVGFIRKTYPGAPIPPVYLSATIIGQAVAERASYGDEPFFKRLNEGATASKGWGDLEGPWDAAAFEAAAAAAPDSELHLRLVSTLLKTVATAHADVLSQRGGNFVRFDQGLSIISQHAKNLGYDALILFLDELILWLATNSQDLGFVKREAAKLTNLVEAQSADRPIPIVSFVARQRDLRELVGDHVPGAEKLSFADSLDWQQGRFDKITLEDRNLPAIAEKRILKTKSESARAELNAAFEQTARMKDGVMNILLTREGDRQMFRRLYPFSPALVQTLIAVSSVLQRERTALKVMMQLLVDQRDTLKVGDVVPVGDLFDVVAHGDEAFSQDMAIHFDNAKRLYHHKLLPALVKQHDMRAGDVDQLPHDDPRRMSFRNDDRLIKTLLLSALVPEVESLRALNAEKLAALNHGTIKTPVQGREAQEVLRRFKNWAADVGEIRIGEEINPTISIQLSGVDTESIVEQARREDNQGNRVRRVRQMIFDQLGIRGEGEFEQYHEFLWRNTRRSCVVLFKNIRELPDSSLENSEEAWKLVIDFPFDEAGHGPRDDLATLRQFSQSHRDGARTLCWVPSFFSHDAQKDLGMLVILEHVLTGERFGQYSNHLSPQDRPAAKSLLENQRSVLKQRVLGHLDAAYGLDALTQGSLDTVHDLDQSEHYVSLSNGLVPQQPVAANLAGAMQNLLAQALEHQFPGAPYFEAEVKIGTLKKVYELTEPSTRETDGRTPVEKTQRLLVRQIANPLLLGDMGVDATHFVLGQHWKNHFTRKAAETGAPISVRLLRDWINDPKPMGLPKEAQNLVILMFAAQTNHVFYQHGSPIEVNLATIPEVCELRRVNLPPADTWELAVQRAGTIFGVGASGLLTSGNVNTLTTEVKQRASETRQGCQRYRQRLRDRLTQQGLDVDNADRLKTAAATQALVDRLCSTEPGLVVNLLATAAVTTSENAMGECVSKAAELEGNLDTAGWDIFDAVGKLSDERQQKAQEIVSAVRLALVSDEHVKQLAPALKGEQARAVQLLTKPVERETPRNEDGPRLKPPERPGRREIIRDAKEGLTISQAEDCLARLRRDLKTGQTARINLGWVIEEGREAS
jgi:hypothetical protein